MSLSKPIYALLGKYFEQLYTHPLRTRAISSCVIAVSGNVASQYLSGAKVLNRDSILAYGLFGFLFGGTLPYYFYNFLDGVVPPEASFAVVKRLLFERLIYAPIYQAFALYTIARLEGKTHDVAVQQVVALYWPVLKASWKYLTIVQVLNLSLVPPMLRVLVINLVGFFWTIFLAQKRARQQAALKKP